MIISDLNFNDFISATFFKICLIYFYEMIRPNYFQFLYLISFSSVQKHIKKEALAFNPLHLYNLNQSKNKDPNYEPDVSTLPFAADRQPA
jgi:hypothetical protein